MGIKKCAKPTVFVRGNHEDHKYLQQYRNGGTVDPYGALHYLTGRRPIAMALGESTVRIAGIGGIALSPGRDSARRSPDAGHVSSEIDALMALETGSVDILLTHDAPMDHGLRSGGDCGSQVITMIIQHLQPRYVFFGHYHDPPEPFAIGKTTCIGMTNRNGWRLPGRDGAMGILNPSDWSFRFVGAAGG